MCIKYADHYSLDIRQAQWNHHRTKTHTHNFEIHNSAIPKYLFKYDLIYNLLTNTDSEEASLLYLIIWLHIFVKGLLQVAGTSFILVFIYGVALNPQWVYLHAITF